MANFPDSKLFQSFLTEVAQNDLKWPILPNSQLFQCLFSLQQLRMTWNSQFHPIHNFSNLFPLKLLRMTWNGQFCPTSGGSTYKSFWHAPPPNRTEFFHFYICFHQKAPVLEVGAPSNEGWHPPQWEILDLPLPTCNFSNPFASKWLKMTRNDQFRMIDNFSH